MKQFSTVLHIVLLASVVVLFYLHFKDRKTTMVTAKPAKPMMKDSCAIGHLIAYVDLDSLNNNVSFIKDKKKELEAEQKQIGAEYDNAYREMEFDRNSFLKKGNAITQKEAEDFQNRMIQKQQEVESIKQAKSQKLAAKGADIMENIQGKLKSFINDYNRDKKYSYIFATGSGNDIILYKDSVHNITGDVIKGLNEIMDKKGN